MTSSTPTLDITASPSNPHRKPATFWLSFVAVTVCNVLSALDITAVATTLPTVTHDLNGGDKFVWVGAAYALAATAIAPLTGRLADSLGRRPTMLGCIAFFFVGSALSGSAQNMSWLIAARAIQGIGGGGIFNLSTIIVSDLVSLAERGTYQGIIILAWGFSAAVGPLIGGVFAEDATWRWLFYLNLPLSGIAFVLVAVFLRVRTPEGSVLQKLARIDLIGNAIVITGTTLALTALTWGGIQFGWSSTHVLVPLVIGFALIVVFFLYEFLLAEDPSIPLDVLSNRTSVAGYISNFFHGIVSMSLIYYIPVYFQVCKGAGPIRSSIDTFPIAFVLPVSSMLSGVTINLLRKYRHSNYIGWALMMLGFGLLSLLKEDASTAQWVCFQGIVGAGVGIVWTGIVFPILAPLSVKRIASALGFFNFGRTFAQTWGIAISASILQNELKKKLPPEFSAEFPEGVEIAYAVIPLIRTLEPELQQQVRVAFATSMAMVWRAMVGFSAGGLLALLLMREVPMQTHTDEKYGLEGTGSGSSDSGKGSSVTCEDSPSASGSKSSV